jgi:hypothetical protein
MRQTFAVALLFAVAIALGSASWPAAAATGFAALTPAQQAALAPLSRDWATMDAAGRQRWLEVASRFPTMPPAERQRVQARMAEWARMTPTERTRARLQFQETRQISAQDRQARWEAYKALPEAQRKALEQRAKHPPRPNAHRPPATVRHGGLPPGRPPAAKAVAPTLVQARPGATTTLMSPRPPAPQASAPRPGQPRIAATPANVNPKTLLPRRQPPAPAPAASAPGARP